MPGARCSAISTTFATRPPAGVFGFFGFVALQIGRRLIGSIRRGRQPCPNCGGAGLIEESEAAQDTGDGATRRVIWRRCPNCGWRGPRETRSGSNRTRSRSRSGGGGFGGGRSSGGGASGRW